MATGDDESSTTEGGPNDREFMAAKGDADVNYENVGMEMSDSGDRFCLPTSIFKLATK